MPLRLPLPDDLLDRLDLDAATCQQPVEQVALRHLQRSILYPLTDRLLILTAADRQALEATLGPLKDTPALLKAVRDLNDVSIQGVRLKLDPWQLEEIHRKSEKNGTTVKQEIEVAVKAIQDLAFSGFHA